jgi:hypothetical protein
MLNYPFKAWDMRNDSILIRNINKQKCNQSAQPVTNLISHKHNNYTSKNVKFKHNKLMKFCYLRNLDWYLWITYFTIPLNKFVEIENYCLKSFT